MDLGLALGQFILQAVADGFVAHPMAGFDRAAEGANPGLVAKERAPRTRLPLSEVAFAGSWGQGFER